MFGFETKPSGKGVNTLVKGAAIAAALAFSSVATQASAAVVLTSASMNTAYTAVISGSDMNKSVYVGPIVLKAYDDVTHTTLPDMVAFCIDIYHNISLGNLDPDGAGPKDGLLYNSGALITNFAPGSPSLNDTQKAQIGSLVNYGSYLYKTDAVANAFDLAGIQGAIWEIANPGYNVGSGALGNKIDYYTVQRDYGKGSAVNVIVPADGKTQAFAMSAVPEPAVWGLMLVGFFGMGGALRRHRRTTILAVAAA